MSKCPENTLETTPPADDVVAETRVFSTNKTLNDRFTGIQRAFLSKERSTAQVNKKRKTVFKNQKPIKIRKRVPSSEEGEEILEAEDQTKNELEEELNPVAEGRQLATMPPESKDGDSTHYSENADGNSENCSQNSNDRSAECFENADGNSENDSEDSDDNSGNDSEDSDDNSGNDSEDSDDNSADSSENAKMIIQQ